MGHIQCFVKYQPAHGINHRDAAAWLTNNPSWVHAKSGVYKESGPDGPATNLLDGDLGTIWNAGGANKGDGQDYVTFNMGTVFELSKFQYFANARPEAQF